MQHLLENAAVAAVAYLIGGVGAAGAGVAAAARGDGGLVSGQMPTSIPASTRATAVGLL